MMFPLSVISGFNVNFVTPLMLLPTVKHTPLSRYNSPPIASCVISPIKSPVIVPLADILLPLP